MSITNRKNTVLGAHVHMFGGGVMDTVCGLLWMRKRTKIQCLQLTENLLTEVPFRSTWTAAR